MKLRALRVRHQSKQSSATGVSFPVVGEVFAVETCQRRLWIDFAEPCPVQAEFAPELSEGIDEFRGEEAYRFLLEVTTGLASAVQGEADIFGQFKEAWRKFESEPSRLTAELGPWIQKIFEDTKEIRFRHLQNLGSTSYGGLVRALLKADGLSPVLVIGAGQIAQEVAPWLLDRELLLMNRSAGGLEALHASLSAKPEARLRRVGVDASQDEAWNESAHVIVCIPIDEEGDKERIARLRESAARHPGRQIIHLGALRNECGAWSGLSGFSCLDDLFALQKTQNEARASQFARARAACFEKARLRALPGSPAGSATLPHGWEDLAVFA